MEDINEIDLQNDIVEDDLEIFEIIDLSFPRQVYERAHYMNSFEDLSFFKRFRLTKETTMAVVELIENELEFPYDR